MYRDAFAEVLETGIIATPPTKIASDYIFNLCGTRSEKLCYFCSGMSGSEQGVFWKRGLFRKVHFLEVLENLEILEFLENPQTVEKKGDSDHLPESLENLKILEIPEISPVKRPLS